MTGRDLTAEDVIRVLGLAPHPEGGHYVETFRDAATREDRSASTAIYFLLRAGEVSRWHRVDAAETWHWYAGEPLELQTAAPEALRATTTLLGSDLLSGERPQAVVAAGHWQRARSLGAWTLVGCTVAPGFTFAGFELAPPDFAIAGESHR